jgi:hypothetical protein
VKKIIIIFLLTSAFCSCSEDDIEKDDATDSQGSYSGITQTDYEGNFITIDMDDWRDDVILQGCYAYPNPANYYVHIRYELLSDAYVLVLIRNFKGERIKLCDAKGVAAAIGGVINVNYGDLILVGGTSIWCRTDLQSDGQMGKHSVFWDLRIVESVEKLGQANFRPLYGYVAPGIYRVFISATDNEVIYKQLKDTGVTNAQKEKYSVVYGDIKIGEPAPAKLQRTEPPNGGEMNVNYLSIYFDAPVKQVYVNDYNASCQDKVGKLWSLHKGNLKEGVQTVKIRWINYDDTEGSHSITVNVVK